MRRLVIATMAVLSTAACGTSTAAVTRASGTQLAWPVSGTGSTPSAARAAGSAAVPVPTSAKHYFKVGGVAGSATTGDWYWAKYLGKTGIIFDFHVKDLRADGKAAGLCYYWAKGAVPSKGVYCIVDTLGSGKTVSQHWAPPLPLLNPPFPTNQLIPGSAHLTVAATTGKLDTKHNIFNVIDLGHWQTLR